MRVRGRSHGVGADRTRELGTGANRENSPNSATGTDTTSNFGLKRVAITRVDGVTVRNACNRSTSTRVGNTAFVAVRAVVETPSMRPCALITERCVIEAIVLRSTGRLRNASNVFKLKTTPFYNNNNVMKVILALPGARTADTFCVHSHRRSSPSRSKDTTFGSYRNIRASSRSLA